MEAGAEATGLVPSERAVSQYDEQVLVLESYLEWL
jgi:hypothetical protein